MKITLEMAKGYLRQDSSDEDTLIEKMIESAEKICRDIARTGEEVDDTPEFELAVLYALAYLYEHREEADHSEMMITLRALLSGSRKEMF